MQEPLRLPELSYRSNAGMRAHIHARVCVHVRTACMEAHARTYEHLHAHAHTHMEGKHAHMHVNICTHARTHACTHIVQRARTRRCPLCRFKLEPHLLGFEIDDDDAESTSSDDSAASADELPQDAAPTAAATAIVDPQPHAAPSDGESVQRSLGFGRSSTPAARAESPKPQQSYRPAIFRGVLRRIRDVRLRSSVG